MAEANIHEKTATTGAAGTNGNGHAHGDGGHHHRETFITKYIFCQDHKTIAKQFLITGIIWGVIGGFFSVIFR